MGHAFTHVGVLVIARRHAVEAFGEKRVPPLQYPAALGCEQGVPTVHGFPAAVFVLFDEEPVAQARLEQHAAVGPAMKLDGEPAAQPVAGGGAQDEVRQ